MRRLKDLDGKPDGGALLRWLGQQLKQITGLTDFSFGVDLPAAGTKVVLLRVLCALRELTLADGGATLSGAFVDSFERTLGLHIVRSNIQMECHRKGEDGVELTHGQAGCVDPTGRALRALSDVKELHFIGVLAAGLKVVGIIASSNA